MGKIQQDEEGREESQQDEENTADLFDRIREAAATEFNNQYTRAKRQDWWTISKMWMVFSVSLILSAGVGLTINYVISLISNMNVPLLISLASLVAGFGGPSLFYIVGIAFLAAIGGAVSIATGNEEFLKLESKRQRYVVHTGKLIVASILLVGYYQFLFRDAGGGILEFLVVILALTGLLLLPFGLILWGALGIKRERSNPEW